METVLGRYRNLIVLVMVLFVQVLGLAVQVKRTTDTDSSRLIRIWAVEAISPLEKALGGTQNFTGNLWHNYLYLRGVRAENRTLKEQLEQLKIEQVRLSQDADQARRLQNLLAFKEQFISKTMAAQVIGSTGSEQSRGVYLDKGEKDGIKPDMAVITGEGVVGKVLRVFRTTSLVLLISDQTSGVGAILEKSRLQGILRGMPSGEVGLERVMSDEQVPQGEVVLTSGGDRIFPKGLPIGHVMQVTPGGDFFLNIRVRPSANLSKLEEVLIVTKIDERQAQPDATGPSRAADILAERLPTVPPKAPDASKLDASGSAAAPGAVVQSKPNLPKAKASGTGADGSLAVPVPRKVVPPGNGTSNPAAAGNGTSKTSVPSSKPATETNQPANPPDSPQ
jgi:rod shape-determining protein MreC